MALPQTCQKQDDDNTLNGLTPKRKEVLSVLTAADRPLSAYEIVDLYNQTAHKPIHAMSVYRILDFLKSVDLVTHLHSVNKFLARGQAAGRNDNSVCLYVTCQQCCGVQKLVLERGEAATIQNHIHRLGYQLSSHSIEIPGLCENCSPNSDTTIKES
tara:strand:- start:710 stop:1180 length:471 start_codon:yes stop_codon:yes gene_type:complete